MNFYHYSMANLKAPMSVIISILLLAIFARNSDGTLIGPIVGLATLGVLALPGMYLAYREDANEQKTKNKKLAQDVKEWKEIALRYSIQFDKLTNKHDKLVQLINNKGGQKFLDNATLTKPTNTQFTKQEVRQLIALCHPDKHNGKQSATNLTQKLIKMRS